MPYKPPCEILEIVQPLTQIGIIGSRDAHARLVLHAFHCGFCGQSGAHCIHQTLTPTLIIREQPIGFDHFPCVAGEFDFRGLQHGIDG